jgi:hypothetical protein
MVTDRAVGRTRSLRRQPATRRERAGRWRLYTGEPFDQGVEERLGATAGRQARSVTHLCRAPQALGGRALLRLAGEVPTALDKLKLNSSLQFVHLAFLVLILRRS